MNFKSILFASTIYILQISSALTALFGVSPTRLTFENNQRVKTIMVNNGNDEALVVHLKVMLWTQQDGKDVYTETQDLMAVPNVVTIQPKSSQTIRIAHRSTPDPIYEKAYRIYIHELPIKKLLIPEKKPPLKFIMCMGVPIFIEPIKPLIPKIHVELVWNKDMLMLKNLGYKHLHLQKTRYHPHQKQAQEVFQNVLPNQSVAVEIPKAGLITGSKFVMHIDDKVVELNVPPKS